MIFLKIVNNIQNLSHFSDLQSGRLLLGGTVWQVGEEAMHPGAEGRKVVIFFVHFEKEILYIE